MFDISSITTPISTFATARNTVKYANSRAEAERIAQKMKKDEPAYASDVEISETVKESFGIYKRTDLGKFVIHNETK